MIEANILGKNTLDSYEENQKQELKLFKVDENKYSVRFQRMIHSLAGGYVQHTIYLYFGTYEQCKDFIRTAKHQKKVF